LFSGLEYGRSVPSLRRTAYCVGVRSLRHSSSVWLTSNLPEAASAGRGVQPRALAMARPSADVPATRANRLPDVVMSGPSTVEVMSVACQRYIKMGITHEKTPRGDMPFSSNEVVVGLQAFETSCGRMVTCHRPAGSEARA